jgi:phage-related minor tail protein
MESQPMACSACHCICKSEELSYSQSNNILVQLENIGQEVQKHWDLNYKANENLSQRISKHFGDLQDQISSLLGQLEGVSEHIDDFKKIGVENRLNKIENVFGSIIKVGKPLKFATQKLKLETCTVCNGVGKLEESYTCPKCEGKGNYI